MTPLPLTRRVALVAAAAVFPAWLGCALQAPGPSVPSPTPSAQAAAPARAPAATPGQGGATLAESGRGSAAPASVNVAAVPPDAIERRYGIDFSQQGLLFRGGARVEVAAIDAEAHFSLSLPNAFGAQPGDPLLLVWLGPDTVADGLVDLVLVGTGTVGEGNVSGTPIRLAHPSTGGVFAFVETAHKVGLLTGSVVAIDGSPVVGATVWGPGEYGLKAITGRDGAFTLGVPVEGPAGQVVTIIASHPGSPNTLAIHREVVEFVEHSPPSAALKQPVRLAFESPAPLLLPFSPAGMPAERTRESWGRVTTRVREIVWSDIRLLSDAGFDVSAPLAQYERASALLEQGEYRQAWLEYQAAFVSCLALPSVRPLVPYWYPELPLLPQLPDEEPAQAEIRRRREEAIMESQRIAWRGVTLMEQEGLEQSGVEAARRAAEEGDRLLQGTGDYDRAWAQYRLAYGLVPRSIKEIPEWKGYEPPGPDAIPPPLEP